jgi:hypothetical protein
MLESVGVHGIDDPLVITRSSISEENGVMGLRLFRMNVSWEESIVNASGFAIDGRRSPLKSPGDDDPYAVKLDARDGQADVENDANRSVSVSR